MKKSILVLFVLFLSIVLISGCSERVDSSTEDNTQTDSGEAMNVGVNSVGVEMRRSETIQKHLTETQPQPIIDYSLERQNIIERTKRWNDPNKLSYIYLLSDMGTIMAYYPVEGKVSSVNSALSTPQQIVSDPNARYRENRQSLLLESPQEDGSYGENGDAIFFFTTDGTYVEWNGKYMLSDEPLKLTQEPVMIYEVEE